MTLHFGHQQTYDPLFFLPKFFDPSVYLEPNPSKENASPLLKLKVLELVRSSTGCVRMCKSPTIMEKNSWNTLCNLLQLSLYLPQN